MPQPCHGGWQRGARQDNANRQHHQPDAAEDHGVELARGTTVVFFINPVPRWMMELARTTPIVFFIKPVSWMMEARSSEDAAAFRGHDPMEFAKTTPMLTSSMRCHGGWIGGACEDAAAMPRWMDGAR